MSCLCILHEVAFIFCGFIDKDINANYTGIVKKPLRKIKEGST